jgi:hypothetical protein
MRDWTELLVTAKPLYADEDELSEAGIDTEQQMIADERHQLLCDTDFNEYRVSRCFLHVILTVFSGHLAGHSTLW